jgi:hypothetical protein
VLPTRHDAYTPTAKKLEQARTKAHGARATNIETGWCSFTQRSRPLSTLVRTGLALVGAPWPRDGALLRAALIHCHHFSARFMDSTQVTFVVSAQDGVAIFVRATADADCLITSPFRCRSRLPLIAVSVHP